MSQTTLLPSPPQPAAARRSSKGIGPGDIVEVDKKGRRFHALVTEVDQVESGRFHLTVRPLDSRVSYRQATVREVVAVLVGAQQLLAEVVVDRRVGTAAGRTGERERAGAQPLAADEQLRRRRQ